MGFSLSFCSITEQLTEQTRGRKTLSGKSGQLFHYKVQARESLESRGDISSSHRQHGGENVEFDFDNFQGRCGKIKYVMLK